MSEPCDSAGMRARDLGVTSLFFLSGTSGLVFEVVWLRYLTLVVGHTTFAASVVVSGFLGSAGARASSP